VSRIQESARVPDGAPSGGGAPAPYADLASELALLDERGLLRHRRVLETPQGARVSVDGREYIAFCSNDYLGLASDPELIEAARQGATRFGVGAGASHLVLGHSAAHHELEERLAAFTGLPRALLFSTGYMANLGVVTALAGRGDAVFADRLNHASLNDAALLSRATLRRYRHADLEALERMLAGSRARRKLVVTDAVFSMDGDIAPLPEILALAERHDAWVIVDDAHGLGVLGAQGRGSLAHFGLASERLILMGTLGKAVGVAGAFVFAHPVIVDWLVQTARPYIYTTAAPPAIAHATAASLAIVRSAEGDARRAVLRERIAQLRSGLEALIAAHPSRGWQLPPSDTPIQPLVVGDNEAALRLSAHLESRGLWVTAIRPPTVPPGTARLRITLSAAHSPDDVQQLIDTLADAVEPPR
jgi:8-amino-7-oxononanoate synthase